MDTVLDSKTSTSAQEKPRNTLPNKWNYDTTREYLLALSRGPEFRLDDDSYPEELVLNAGWHKTLNAMRQYSSAHNAERYAAIGFKDARNTLFLPVDPGHGREGSITSQEIMAHENRMIQNGDIKGFIGDLHSHPKTIEPSRPLDKIANLDYVGFSMGDLYGFLKDSNKSMRGITEGPFNIFVFKTKKSIGTKAPDYQAFAEAWYRRNGWKYEDAGIDGERATRVEKNAPSLWELNKRIAREYGLVLYKGEQEKPIKKVSLDQSKPKLLTRLNPFASGK